MSLKYLSEILETDTFQKGCMNVIVAPCGCGKSNAAINVVAPLASKPYKALYLIDTRNGCQRIAKEEKLTLPCECYDFDIIHNGFDADFDKTKVVVATYAKFGVWCSQYPGFADHFEVIICDEVHNLVQFSTFGELDNFTAIARDSICAATKKGKTLFVGITATPDYLKHLRCPQHFVPLDRSNLVHYTEKNMIHYASINQLLRRLPANLRGALYVVRVQQMKEFASIARECGHNPICLWSRSYKEPMNEEQMRVLSYLLENEAVPPEYDMLIINASCETAINIRSHMDYFIVHNSNDTHRKQARGRYRGNLDTLYLLDKENGTIIMPPEYLDRPLFKEDKEALINQLAIKNDKGRNLPWNKLSQMITDSGFTISEGRSGDRPFIIINKL